MAHTHTSQCLQKAAERDVGYELRQMAAMAGAEGVGDGGDLANTALLEAFLTHARTLDAFLFGPGRQRFPHDVYAEDYLPGWRANALPKPQVDAISKRIMHLMCDRESQVDWDHHQDRITTARSVLDAFETFVQDLSTAGNPAVAWFAQGLADANVEFAKSTGGAYRFERV